MCILLLDRLWWGPLLPPAIYAGALVLVYLTALIPLAPFEDAGAGAHWTERAKLAYPVGRLFRFQQFLLVLSSGVFGAFTSNICAGGDFVWQEGALDAFAAYLGALTGQYFIARRIYPELANFREWAALVWIRTATLWLVLGLTALLTVALNFYLHWPRPSSRNAPAPTPISTIASWQRA